MITCPHGQLDPQDIGGSALDLRLGSTVLELAEGQRPATRELAKIMAKSSRVQLQSDSNGDFFLFKKKHIYLVQLDYFLELPQNINGRATGKSSIGRLDVITRLLTQNS